jgi:hypothetical protein
VVRDHEIAWLQRQPTAEPTSYFGDGRGTGSLVQDLENCTRKQRRKIEVVLERFEALKNQNVSRQEEIVALRDGVSKI